MLQQQLDTVDEMIAIVEGKVEGRMWIKGENQLEIEVNGRPGLGMCIGGMVERILQSRVAAWGIPAPGPVGDGASPLVLAIGKVIMEQYPDRARGHVPQNAIVPFNDHEDTTPDDVVRVLQKARIALVEAVA